MVELSRNHDVYQEVPYPTDERRVTPERGDKAKISGALGVELSTVERVRPRCVEEGIESAPNRKKQLRRRQKRLDGEGEARLMVVPNGSSSCWLTGWWNVRSLRPPAQRPFGRC